MLRFAVLLLLSGLLAWGTPPEPAAAEGFSVTRPKVRKSSRERTGPTLPSEVEPEEEEPSPASQAYEEYQRERAEYYREKRRKEQREKRPPRGAGTCIYGADGQVLYAPAGRSCGGPP